VTQIDLLLEKDPKIFKAGKIVRIGEVEAEEVEEIKAELEETATDERYKKKEETEEMTKRRTKTEIWTDNSAIIGLSTERMTVKVFI